MKSIAITTIVLTILGGIGFVAYLSDRQPEGDSLSAAPVIRPAQGGTGTSTTPSTDQVLIGIGGGAYGLKQIVAGTDISISTSSNRITINSTASGSGSGELSDWEQTGGFLTPTTTIGIDVNATSTLATTTIDSLNVIASFTSDLATALAANGANCSAGNAPLGVDASGAVESCFDVWTEAENTAAAYLSSVDISDNTNLSGDTEVILTGDALSLGEILSFNYGSSTGYTVTNLYASGLNGVVSISATTESTIEAAIDSLSSLTSNGFVKTGSGNGTLSIDTTTYESGLTAGDGLTRTVNDFDCDTASGSVFGCLSSTDWTTFNSKQSTISVTHPILLSGATLSLAFSTTTANTWSLLQTFTTGGDFGGGVLEIPNGANPTVDAAGEIALNTTNASLSVATSTTYAELPVYPPLTFSYASSSWTGTTTSLTYPTDNFGEFITGGICYADGGAKIRIGDSTNWSNVTTLSSGTTSVSFTSNNRFNAGGERVIVQVGTPTTLTLVACKFERVYER